MYWIDENLATDSTVQRSRTHQRFRIKSKNFLSNNHLNELKYERFSPHKPAINVSDMPSATFQNQHL